MSLSSLLSDHRRYHCHFRKGFGPQWRMEYSIQGCIVLFPSRERGHRENLFRGFPIQWSTSPKNFDRFLLHKYYKGHPHSVKENVAQSESMTARGISLCHGCCQCQWSFLWRRYGLWKENIFLLWCFKCQSWCPLQFGPWPWCACFHKIRATIALSFPY